MKKVGLFEAKTHLSQLVTEVERGEEIIVTRRGKAVARLVPMSDEPRVSAQQAAEEIRELRKGLSLGGLSIKDLIDEGRM